jgi:hypothetical protein
MRARGANTLGRAIEKFFREYLPTLRGTSPMGDPPALPGRQ